ncbi:MAG: inositol monophosphatase [Clostridia bacterium]|nr:inositol monophosphatase [Clostridia bacterium]
MSFEESVIEIMKEAGKIMTDSHDVERVTEVKPGDVNFVTAYDLAVQKFLTERLSALLPGVKYLAEEDEVHVLTDAPTFIIDPIDGTTNFIHGVGHSCISVALCEGGETTYAFIYDPYREELFTAVKGKGAYSHRKGKSTKLSVTGHGLRDSLIIVGTDPYRKSETWPLTMDIFAKLLLAGRDLRRSGSAALDLAYLAAGRYDLFFELMLSPWDYAAGMLLLTEAGGVITTMDKKPLPMGQKCSVVAGTPNAHRDFYREIRVADTPRVI